MLLYSVCSAVRRKMAFRPLGRLWPAGPPKRGTKRKGRAPTRQRAEGRQDADLCTGAAGDRSSAAARWCALMAAALRAAPGELTARRASLKPAEPIGVSPHESALSCTSLHSSLLL